MCTLNIAYLIRRGILCRKVATESRKDDEAARGGHMLSTAYSVPPPANDH